MKEEIIYMDYNATTPVDSRVLEEMLPYFISDFGNPASSHQFGKKISQVVENARSQVAELIGAEKKEIVFTSGATEAINLAIKGFFEGFSENKNHMITVSTEHKAVLDTCNYLESKGIEVTYLSVDQDGLIDLKQFENSIKPETGLISVMYVNNETGVIQPIKEIIEIAKKYNICIFCDATQAVGKIPVDVKELGLDLLCFSGHKIYGPKGIGVLFIDQRLKKGSIISQIHGGGQENQHRSGTLNVPGIIGLGKACEIIIKDLKVGFQDKIRARRDQLEREILKFSNTYVIGSRENRVFNTTNICFKGQDANVLIGRMKNIAVSNGAACSSSIVEPSHVLKSMGLTDEDALSCIRFSLGKSNTQQQVKNVVEHLKEFSI